MKRRLSRYFALFSAFVVFVVFGVRLEASGPSANLIEYSYGGFAAGDVVSGPMLLPPAVKIYQDGRIVFMKDGRAWVGQVAPKRLSKLKNQLAEHKLLEQTRLVQVRRGSSLGVHGGMVYIRYLEDEDEVLLGSLLLPSSGPWKRLTAAIRNCIPTTYSSFVPEEISVRVLSEGRRASSVDWPFSSELPLEPHAGRFKAPLAISRAEAVAFVLTNSTRGFSWLETVVSDSDAVYSLHVREVPGWYEPSRISIMLGFLAADTEVQD